MLRLRSILYVTWLLLASGSPVSAQVASVDPPVTPSGSPAEAQAEVTTAINPIDVTPTPEPAITAERLTELLKQARESSAPDELKNELVKRYQAAQEWLQGSEESRRKIAQFELEMQEGTERIEKAQQALSQSTPDVNLQPLDEKSLSELEALLGDAKARLDTATTKLAEREAELKNRAERKAELTKKLEELKSRQEEAESQLQLPAPAAEAPELTAARRSELETRQQYLRLQSELHQAEIRRNEKLAELFPLLRDLAKRDANLATNEVALLQSRVDQARKLESERQAVEARRAAELADPAIRDLAEHNATLAEKRQRIAEKITHVSAEVQTIKKQLAALNHDFQRAQDQVEKAGHTAIVGLMLRRHHDSLPSVKRCQERLSLIDRETPVLSLELMEYEDERTALGDIGAVRDQIMRNLDAELNHMHGAHLQQTVSDLLGSQKELLNKVTSELNAYLSSMSELEAANRELILAADGFRAFIDENVLWIRSADPLWIDDGPRAVDAVQALVSPQAWLQLVHDSGVDTLRQPVMAAAVIGLLVLLLTHQSRLRRRVRGLCACRVNSQGWHFLPAIRALLLTSIVTVQGPLMTWYVGWRMTSADRVSDLGLALGPALRYAAVLAWLSTFLRALCRRDGVAETFFDWPRSSLDLARRSLRWLTSLGLPLTMLAAIAHEYDQAEWTNSLGRIAFILVMAMLVVFTHRTLNSKDNIFSESIARDPKGWLNRMRWFAYSVGVAVPFLLSILAAVGYYYSAQQLAVRLQASLAMALLALLVHAVASRWFVVKGRRLAMHQARERQQQSTCELIDGSISILPSPAKQQTDWTAVHERLRLLLRQAITAGVLLSSWLIWADVLPALRILDRVELWSQTSEVVEHFEGADGKLVQETRLEVRPTTLRHGLISLVSLFAAFVLGKNLPALLEITVLSHLPLDRGGRHAVSVILHYGVALAGLMVAFRTMHINWSSVQWLVAGMTVGLGFGLQEIFANFVSGIILLFERPIRVGDVITLDDVSGTVTDIRVRATTVTNWDRKELIVPNKDLVTGRLLNWTLSDTTNRIVIKVGLAYDTDVMLARELLQEVVCAHPNVLADPPPSVVLDSFGDSALNFVIRVFLSTLDVRLETVHDLHFTILHRLQQAGMELAFPQRDLNIRHVEWPPHLNVNEPPKAHRRNEAA